MNKTITDVAGVYASSIASGIKAEGLDLVYIFVPEAVAAAGVFTKNAFCAPCIIHTRSVINEGKCKAVIINSGNANAVTGESGVRNVAKTATIAAELLGLQPDQVAISSTGIIGKQLPMDIVEAGLHTLLAEPRHRDGGQAATGIMTTDTCSKTCFYEDGDLQVAGIAKGSGMIAPNMATMLGFIVTNVSVSQDFLQAALLEAVDKTFNMISVDTDTSTSDMVLCFASGAVPLDETNVDQVDSFKRLLRNCCQDLAIQIVRDGEGASRLIAVQVHNAQTESEAKRIALSVVNSPLVKTAIHGADPNWGRILMAVGKVEGTLVQPELVDVRFQDTQVLIAGAPAEFDRKSLAEQMRVDTVSITVDLHLGEASATAWGCDLTKGYIDINTCYN
jgi:glutamate N-acetyltransferase / amino-acid N-acetyltransferase